MVAFVKLMLYKQFQHAVSHNKPDAHNLQNNETKDTQSIILLKLVLQTGQKQPLTILQVVTT